MNRLTLCLIARDEEQMLPACLASVRGVVDRIVAADTGSTDRTREILRAAGAEVFEFAWRDDFAAARNAVLERVRDGHVLVLDADERLAGGAGRVLRDALRSGSKAGSQRGVLDCGLLPLHHASTLDASEAEVLSGAKRLVEPVLLPRLLRRARDLRWEGIVHENVGAWLAQPDRVIRKLAAPIVHYGAVPEWRAARGKRERNLALLEARCAAEPTDPTPRAYLVNELLRIGERERARSEIERALELTRGALARGLPLDPTQVLTLHAYTLLTGGEIDAASASLELAREWQCKHPNFDFLTGALLEHRASAAQRTDAGQPAAELLERAALHLERALAAHGSLWAAETLPGATSFAAALRLGQVRLAQRRADAALAAFERVLAEQPDHPQARLGRIEALILGGQPARALGELEPLLASIGADAWLVAAWAARELGQTADARAFTETATRLAPHGSARSARWTRVARALASAA
jgi:tetratricopeptide (TPR) repeat protein